MKDALPDFDNTPRSGVEIAKNTYAKVKQREEEKLLQQLQLPFWSDDQRAVPNGLLRSALFGAIRPGKRRYIDGEIIAALAGIELKYTGQKLDQGDLDVWAALLHIARVMNLGNICYVSTYEILSLLDLADTGSNRKILYKCLTRLRATAIELKQGRYGYLGGLVNEAERDELTGKMKIVFNPRIIALYQYDQYTQIDFHLCNQLKSPLAKWLFRFYSTHANPFPYEVETIYSLCGSEAKSLKDFKNDTLAKALNEVSEVSRKFGKRFESKIIDMKLHVIKSCSTSQGRFLKK
jgi:hypothetical protein